MTEKFDQFGPTPSPPPDPSSGANVAAMQEAMSRLAAITPPVPERVGMESDLGPRGQEEKAAASQITAENNPAEDYIARMVKERGERLSMNVPQRHLEVPPIEGWHLHWFLETNVPHALRAWYEFVEPHEVGPVVHGFIGGRSKKETSDDLGGSRVTRLNKGPGENGAPIAFILMKVKLEFYFQDQRKIAQRNLQIIQQIFKKKAPLMAPSESAADYDKRYTREAVIDMSAGRFKKVG